ncbi:MAG: CBS domain-containing protein [Candidatus Bathyarchaeota archaeon]|nr:CBS domain-containing protein [Candidatus Bathyarchaeota archaeon]
MKVLGTAKDVMNKNVQILSPDEEAESAAEKMIRFNIGSLVVMDGRKLVGIVTKSDYVRAFLRNTTRNLKVADIMSKPVITCDPETSILDIIHTMRLNGIRHIPVAKGSKLMGIVTDFDLACFATSSVSKLLMMLRPPKG